MRVQSSNLVQLANRVYNQIPTFTMPQAPARPVVAQGPAACIRHLRDLNRNDERVTGIGAIINVADTPIVVRLLLGGLFDVRKGIAFAAPLEGLVLTPRGIETLVDGRPQGVQAIPLFNTFTDPAEFQAAVETQVKSLFEDCRVLKARYFAPKNALAALVMKIPAEM